MSAVNNVFAENLIMQNVQNIIRAKELFQVALQSFATFILDPLRRDFANLQSFDRLMLMSKLDQYANKNRQRQQSNAVIILN